MVKRYYGGVISATQAVANASSATGFFNVTQQMQAVQAGAWPLQAPPPQNTAAWFGGGYTFNGASNVSQSTIQRITFATDTAASSVRGPLSAATKQLAAAGNTTDGWFGGGAPGSRSTVARITYATDTATASVRGPLSSARYGVAAVGNNTDAWFGGGYQSSTVDRISYATDTATASVRGPLSQARQRLAAAGNETNGWFGGGYVAYYNILNTTVDRITYATDTATASARGPLSVPCYWIAATGNTTDAWFAGGLNPSNSFGISTVQRVTYATDTATASVRGPLSAIRDRLAAAGNTTDGWFGGGSPSDVSANPSYVNRITYATDTATASVRGPLSAQANVLGAAGGIQ
jgi:hypothetical protein